MTLEAVRYAISVQVDLLPERRASFNTMQHTAILSNVWRQLVILDAHLHALDAGLQKLSRFQSGPDFDHGQITTRQHTSATLGAELSKYG